MHSVGMQLDLRAVYGQVRHKTAAAAGTVAHLPAEGSTRPGAHARAFSGRCATQQLA